MLLARRRLIRALDLLKLSGLISRMDNLSQPSNRELRAAYDHFRSLLARQTRESDWQSFFGENPFVLSRSLPLRLDPREIISCATPGKSEADFIFYQKMGGTVSAYGTIELKRPDSKILTFPRKDLVLLTRDADTAIKQAEKYARSIILPSDVLFLGCPQYLFVIMGLSTELTSAFTKDIERAEFVRLLPPGCQLLPYDELLRRFESTLPEQLIVLVPALPTDEEIISSTETAEAERRDALQRLFSDLSFYKRLQSFARARLLRMGTQELITADDLAQETLLRIWKHPPPEIVNIDTWLWSVVRNVAIDYLRRHRAEETVSDEELRNTLREHVNAQRKKLNADAKRTQPNQQRVLRRTYHRKTP
jgi:RNA polymerase sigma factor (sigma-70 family)